VTIADLMIEQAKNQVSCVRFDKNKGGLIEFVQSAYQIDFQRLDYVIKILNGDLTIKIERY
jgi:hypothetical protein